MGKMVKPVQYLKCFTQSIVLYVHDYLTCISVNLKCLFINIPGDLGLDNLSVLQVKVNRKYHHRNTLLVINLEACEANHFSDNHRIEILYPDDNRLAPSVPHHLGSSCNFQCYLDDTCLTSSVLLHEFRRF